MTNDSFTLIVVPDRRAEVRRFRLSKTWLKRSLGALAGLVLLAVAAAIHYGSVVVDARENSGLRTENLRLKNELLEIREKLRHLDESVDRVSRLDQKLRALTMLSDPQRNLAMGPTENPAAAQLGGTPSANNPFVRVSAKETPGQLRSKLEKVSAEATRQEQSLQELQTYFQGQKSLLASTPSVWPVRGWVTSDFGSRSDPYTSDRVMHSGMDIAGPHGEDVAAPADGVVVFSGLEGSYGNVLVIDHGYGIKTRYGHLAQSKVKAGEKVSRGQVVAALGNTGRSTGPHLHYEVRVNGIAQNPRNFILSE